MTVSFSVVKIAGLLKNMPMKKFSGGVENNFNY